MTLTRQEMRELEAQDGLLDRTADRELAGVAEAWNDVAIVLRDALRPPTAPPLADSVMEVITGLDAPQLLAAGADALAVISNVFDAADITARVKEYRKLFAHEIA